MTEIEIIEELINVRDLLIAIELGEMAFEDVETARMRLSKTVDAMRAAEKPASEPGKLWLWRNGEFEFLAFDNPWPCESLNGDPLTLGEPTGYALFRESVNGRPDKTEEDAMRSMERTADAVAIALKRNSAPEPGAEVQEIVAPSECGQSREDTEADKIVDLIRSTFGVSYGPGKAGSWRLSHAAAAALVQEKLNERDAAQKKAADYHRGWTTAMMQKNDERARADALEAKLAKVMEALEKITRIENKLTGPDWEEIEEAREIARAALAEIDGETK